MEANFRNIARSRILCMSSGDEYLVSDTTAQAVRDCDDEWITIEVLESNGATVDIRPEHVVAIEPVPDDYFNEDEG